MKMQVKKALHVKKVKAIAPSYYGVLPTAAARQNKTYCILSGDSVIIKL